MKNKKINIIPMLMFAAFSFVSAIAEDGCYGSTVGMSYLGDIISVLIMVVLGLAAIWLYQKVTEKRRTSK